MISSTKLVILLILITTAKAQQSQMFDGMCPVPECYCGLDPRGRLEVSCTSGNLNEIPTSRMSPAIEVIKIIGKNNNHLTIGRFFRQFRKIEELHVVGSNIPNIGENNFWGMTSLKLLNLSSNKINLIIDSNFKGLNNLETLSLSSNQIDSFVSASFQHLTSLKKLDLSKNRISKLVERLFYNLHVLEVLDLSDNKLQDINADVFRDIWRLKVFNCQRCGIKVLPSLIYTLLPGLKTLDLRQNELRTLREGEFSALKSINEINLSGNKIQTLPEESFRLTKLQKLVLSQNNLKQIDRTAFINASISELDLSGNKFENINKLIFFDLKKNLTKLDLSSNPNLKLASLLIILSENTKLKWLSISKNNYEDLPLDLFEDNRPLQYLNISYNRLRELFPRQFQPLLSLQILDVSFNRLRGIEQDVLSTFDRISTIREIRLEGNPWACDLCHILPMLKFMKESPIFRKGCSLASNGPFCLRCRTPSHLYSQAIIHLQENNLEWCDPYADEYGDESRLGLFLGTGLLFLILIIIITGIIFRYQYYSSASYYTHEDTRTVTGGTPPLVDYENEQENSLNPGNYYYATINGTHTKIVSTIDEKNFDPDRNFYPDLSVNLNPLCNVNLNQGSRSPSHNIPSPNVNSKTFHNEHLNLR